MNEEKLFNFYEKLYFHELERREKLSARLNTPFALLVAESGFLSYMLQNVPSELSGWYEKTFWLLFLFSILSALVAAWFFRMSWFGHSDKLLPTANETESYRQECIMLYASYPDCDELVEAALRKYLYQGYMDYSTHNTINNDAKAFNIYRSTVAISLSVLLAFLAFVPFVLCKHVG